MKRVVRVQSSEFLKVPGDSLSSSPETNFRELDDVFLQTQTKIWLGEVLHIRFNEETNVACLLADGELLFQVSKVVWKLLLKQNVELKHSNVHIYERTSSGKIDGRYMPYPKVDSFLKICQIMGLKGIDLFTPTDVIEKRDVRRVCMCIRSFSKKALSMHLNVPDFDICTYTIAMPTDLVGGIRRYLEQRQNKYASSNGCNSPSNESKELHQQKTLSGLNILHCDSHSESDGAESIVIDSELPSPLSCASCDDAHLSLINGERSPRENVVYNCDQYELQSHSSPDTYNNIKSENDEESDDYSPLKLDIPHEIEEEYHEQFWLRMRERCCENELPMSPYADIDIVADHINTEFINELKDSSNFQEIVHGLVDGDVKTNCMDYPNVISVLDFENVTQEKNLNEENKDDTSKEDKTNNSFDSFKMDTSNYVIDEFIEEYCNNHQHAVEISGNGTNFSCGFSNSNQKEVENMLAQIIVNRGEIEVAQNHSLSSSSREEKDYSIESQAMYHEKENRHESAIEMYLNNHRTKPVNDEINLCDGSDRYKYEKYSFSVGMEDSKLYNKEILEKDVFSENYPLNCYEDSALNSCPNTLESEPNVCLEGCLNLPKEIQSDKASEQVNRTMRIKYEVDTSNDLSTKECKVANKTLNISEGNIVENGSQKAEGFVENPEENFTKKLGVKTVMEDGSVMRGKEAEDCKKELTSNLQPMRTKQNKVMKSIAGAVTLLGAIFFVHHVRQKKEKEKNTKSTMLFSGQGAIMKVAEIGKKANEISGQKIYPGERLQF